MTDLYAVRRAPGRPRKGEKPMLSPIETFRHDLSVAPPSVPVLPVHVHTPVSMAFQAIQTRRVGMQDWTPLQEWLWERIKDAYPTIERMSFAGKFRQWCDSTEFLFIRTDNAVGLAYLVFSPIHGRADVQDGFVFVREGQSADGQAIYAHFKRWAESMNARDVLPMGLSDWDKAGLREVFGRLDKLDQWYWRHSR